MEVTVHKLDNVATQISSDFLVCEFAVHHPIVLQVTEENLAALHLGQQQRGKNAWSLNSENSSFLQEFLFPSSFPSHTQTQLFLELGGKAVIIWVQTRGTKK